MVTYIREYRNTRMGGITVSIAVCFKCGSVIEPVRRERSKFGSHGKDYYEHEHDIDFVVLKQSNSGKRNFEVTGKLVVFYNDIYKLWIVEGVEVEEVKDYLSKKLAKLAKPLVKREEQ